MKKALLSIIILTISIATAFAQPKSRTQQAEGKAEMDRLSLNLKDNARVVPALRNGTGVNTQEELAKGWIWVTVDAPDGATEKSDKDGTGDTNGAGDLWRIVVGRGVWND